MSHETARPRPAHEGLQAALDRAYDRVGTYPPALADGVANVQTTFADDLATPRPIAPEPLTPRAAALAEKIAPDLALENFRAHIRVATMEAAEGIQGLAKLQAKGDAALMDAGMDVGHVAKLLEQAAYRIRNRGLDGFRCDLDDKAKAGSTPGTLA